MSTSRTSSTKQEEHHVSSLDTDEREGIDDDDDDNDTNVPIWDPIAQIYVGGKVPDITNDSNIQDMIQKNNGILRIFGYGSLCWNPGKIGQSALAHPTVTNCTGQALGYRRVWAQRSTDHRGVPNFPGIVCTLLTDIEYQQFRQTNTNESSVTEGLIYEVPPNLVDECLHELDFREKGGYARDIINVKEDKTGETVQALLYRGTPDNPAFWIRALCDIPFAAATIAAASGPSGKNFIYLDQLDQFLLHVSSCTSILEKFDDTFRITAIAKQIYENPNKKLHFLYGCGSNQHNQLLLHNENNAAGLVNNAEDAYEMKEIVTGIHSSNEENNGNSNDPIVNIVAGGGHSGIITKSGRLYLFGWNEYGQLGRRQNDQDTSKDDDNLPLPFVKEMVGDIRVDMVALGFSHTLVVTKNTRQLLAFGDNSRGQVNGKIPRGNDDTNKKLFDPTCPEFLKGKRIVSVSTGLFHSAAVLENGELVTFGSSGVVSKNNDNDAVVNFWKPNNGTKIIQVSCGRRHTVALDDKGRIWTFGDNKYGQLGRSTEGESVQNNKPGIVQGLGTALKIFYIQCGWSHTVALARDASSGAVSVWGWGRNDKGQLGIVSNTRFVLEPQRLFEEHRVCTVSCGSESTVFVDDKDSLWCCGWNEHGNLGSGDSNDRFQPTMVTGAPITTTPGYGDTTRIAIAAGGAHLLAMRVYDS